VSWVIQEKSWEKLASAQGLVLAVPPIEPPKGVRSVVPKNFDCSPAMCCLLGDVSC
jgi:hypothetical protein